MANNIINVLNVTGEAVKAFCDKVYRVESIKSLPVIDFNTTVPSNGKNLKLWGTKWNAYATRNVESIEGGLQFRFETAWSYPEPWLITTAVMFPNLKFINTWIGKMIDYGGRITIFHEKGKLIINKDELSNHDWNMECDPEYKNEYDFITEGPYDKVIERYTKANEPNYFLNKILLDRIQDRDLPLFIHFDWDELQDEFETRLRSGDKNALV